MKKTFLGTPSGRNRLRAAWKDSKSFFIFVALMLVFRSSFADWNTVPTGSMKPTIVEGDRILINKMAYDIHVPFSKISLFKIANPVRGDIVVFNSEVADKRLVKRVIGLPGDSVAMINNQLVINSTPVTYDISTIDELNSDKLEHLPGVSHAVRVKNLSTGFANFNTVIVPAGHYLVLGDNRDNSADSRVIGFIPREEIIGRSRDVVMSFDYDNFYIPRSERFLKRL